MQQRILSWIVIVAVLLAFTPSGDGNRTRRQSNFIARDRCQSGCSADYRPVCGGLGRERRTFSNQCALNIQRCRNSNWYYVSNGECGTDRCQTACGYNYSPVCGRLGRERRTFNNQCQYNLEQCRNSNWRYEHSGECRRGNQYPRF